MTLEQKNHAIARRLWEEVMGKGDLDVVDEIVADHVIDHDPTPGLQWRDPETTKLWATTIRSAFPDLRVTIEDQIAEGNKVCTRVSIRGTHRGEMMGIAPTGRQVTIYGVAILRIEDGKIVETWPQRDDLGMMQQLGVIPEPA